MSILPHILPAHCLSSSLPYTDLSPSVAPLPRLGVARIPPPPAVERHYEFDWARRKSSWGQATLDSGTHLGPQSQCGVASGRFPGSGGGGRPLALPPGSPAAEVNNAAIIASGSWASGVVVSSAGHILTSAHLLHPAAPAPAHQAPAARCSCRPWPPGWHPLCCSPTRPISVPHGKGGQPRKCRDANNVHSA